MDEALICHLAWVDQDGEPRVIPTIHARVDGVLYVHGSRASRTLRSLRDGASVTIAVTILDGVQFARSMFESSMNYRSVIVYGRTREVTDSGEILTASRAITDHVADGRSSDAREPTESELRQTTFIAVDLDEASAKVSAGQPEDAEDDYALDIWAGILPLRLVAGEPETDPDPRGKPGIEVPAYVRSYRRPGWQSDPARSGTTGGSDTDDR